MNKDEGWVSLYRQFIEWEWYDDANTMRLFIHCLLLANYKDKKWRGKLIKRGSFITSQPKLAHSLKLSIKQIRGSLTKLKTTGEVAVLTTPEYSVITVKNYDDYQDEGRLKGRQTTQEGQAKGRQGATTNNDNKERYINISLSDKKITKDERDILKKYAKKTGAKNIRAYVKKLIDTGDYKDILEEEKKKQEKKKELETIKNEPEIVESAEETKKGYENFKKSRLKILNRVQDDKGKEN